MQIMSLLNVFFLIEASYFNSNNFDTGFFVCRKLVISGLQGIDNFKIDNK